MTTAADTTIPDQRLQSLSRNSGLFVPPVLFMAPLSIGVLSLAWRAAKTVLEWPQIIEISLTYVTILSFVGILALYIMKCLSTPAKFAKDTGNDISCNFLSSVFGCLIVCATLLYRNVEAFLPLRYLCIGMWSVGILGHLGYSLFVFSRWINKSLDGNTLNPTLFVPMSIFFLAPVTGLQLGLADMAWLYFSMGAFLWVLFTPAVFWKTSTLEKLPDVLAPSLFLMAVPPALGFTAWITLTEGVVDGYAELLFNGAVFFVLILLVRGLYFKGLPLSLTWWSGAFAFSCLAQAFLTRQFVLASDVVYAFSIAFLFIATFFVIGMSVLSAKIIFRL